VDIARALESLVPGADFAGTLKDNTPDQYSAIEWKDSRDKPTLAELVEEDARITAGQAAEEFARLRREAYPPVGDQLDAILKAINYWQMAGKLDACQPMDQILGQWLSVKKKYPKPE